MAEVSRSNYLTKILDQFAHGVLQNGPYSLKKRYDLWVGLLLSEQKIFR